MIYTITLNPSLDYVMMVNELKNGETNRSQAEKIYPGGKGFNVSRILNEFGIANKAIGLAAGFSGLEIDRLLNEKGIDHDSVRWCCKEAYQKVDRSGYCRRIVCERRMF